MITQLSKTAIPLENVDGLVPVRKIAPKKNKLKRITQVHGSIRSSDLLEKIKAKSEEEELKKKEKQTSIENKKSLKVAFEKCYRNHLTLCCR